MPKIYPITIDIPLVARLQFCSHPVSRDVSRQQKDFNYHYSSFKGVSFGRYNIFGTKNKLTDFTLTLTGKIIRFVPARFNETTFTFDDARKACKNIASNTDIQKAVEVGDESCACGWVSNITMEAPNPNSSCEEYNRESTITRDSKNTWGVYCLNKY
ncbi:hypothetical protein CHS0354_006164 [Potamilus streckersoni]|uniref:Link domain-containing protein n=1 Tax=Potamilus streckersoni TaxID=2493646 RepID=A0AAE0W1B0_9BIVA|nr:hypothetical protein CHS0354_006164 [Potamilus streckersoni]